MKCNVSAWRVSSSGNFAFEPGQTGGDLNRPRLAVDTPLAARHPLKCFTMLVTQTRDRSIPVSTRATVEQFTGRANKRMAGEIFGIARLFADQHDLRPSGTFAEYGLRRVEVEWACRAFSGGRAQIVDGPLLRSYRLRGIADFSPGVHKWPPISRR
jgi:hypothetical protein